MSARSPMTLRQHAPAISMLQLPPRSPAPEWAVGEPFTSVTWSAGETSIVCPSAALPDELPGGVEGPYTAFEVSGPLDHSLTGVLVALLKPLADARISILTFSTYDTDWVLVRAGDADDTRATWRAAGYEVEVLA